jgi:TonB dependent receptor
VTEPEHLESTERFLAPMDQTHTLTGGLTYRHRQTGLWAGTAIEYGSGTPTEREDIVDARVPGHVTANMSFGVDVLRSGKPRPRVSLQLDIENISDSLYLVAQESEFAAGQYSIPRLVSVTAKVRF